MESTKPKAYIVFSRLVLAKEKGGHYAVEKKITCPSVAYDIIKVITGCQDEAQEVFGIITVNTKNQIISVHEISRGSVNASIVHPREVFKVALLHNAAAVFLFHNHPSGDPTPSREDREVTARLVESGKLLGIEVLDHLIVGDDQYYSMKERGAI